VTTAKTARWLDLIAFLLGHHFPVTREDIYRNVRGYLAGGGKRAPGGAAPDRESARRKFERDKDELRALGIDIETVELPGSAGDEPQQGYRLKPSGFYLPYFELHPSTESSYRHTALPPDRPYSGLPHATLSEAELRILDRATRHLAQREELSLAGAAAAARRKLAFDLPLDDAALEQVLAAPLPEHGRQSLEVLQRALMDRIPVSCRYYSISRDSEEQREIEPYGLFFQWSHWYCVARARDRDALRVFRIDRMREAKALDDRPTFQVPASFDVRTYLGKAPWELGQGPVTTVRVRFAFPESRWVLNRRMGRPVDPVLDDGGAVLEFDTRDRSALLRWLLSLRRQATVLEPRDVADELDDLRRRVASLYQANSA
jgi:predicted DNA-binding transcriptional regulator YafY